MSSARRAFDLIRGYVNHGWDAITDSEEASAQAELKKAIENPIPSAKATPQETPPEQIPITLDQARKLFEVGPSATSKQITEAYDLLRSSATLSKFEEGSDAWQRARVLNRRLDAARNILMENIDPTVRRFEKLEIE